MKKIIYYSQMFTILMAGLLLFFVFYSLFFPIQVIKPNRQPYKVLTPIVKPGGKLIYVIDACKYIETTSYVSRRFVDGIVISLPLASNNVPKGCFKTTVSLMVPGEIDPGTWHLELDVEYKLNFLRSVTYHFETEKFTVIAGDKVE